MSTKVKLSSLRVDSARERNGDWVESITIPGVTFYVRSINYPPYSIARDMLMQRLRRKAGSRMPAPDQVYPELGRLFAEHILLDWKGFEEEFTPDLALRMLTDPEYRELVIAIELAAGQVAQAEIEFVEEATKNSEVPSATS